MVKLITSAMALAAVLPVPGHKEIVKLPLAGDASLIVKVVPHQTERVDGNYVAGDETPSDATERYTQLKQALDERFARMFELKEIIDGKRGELEKQESEYYALREKYNRELKKIIAAWVTESNYLQDGSPATPDSRMYEIDGNSDYRRPPNPRHAPRPEPMPYIEK